MKTDSSLSLRVITHNIRYATSSPFKNERLWSERKQSILNELHYHTRHCPNSFICLQEVLHVQLVDLSSGLNGRKNGTSPSERTQWAYIGVGRDDGREAGEYSPIFYQPTVWQLRHWETVWLSETPSVPSKSWDSASIRILTIGVFSHLVSNKTILAMNTHLDNQGSHSRFKAAHIILGKIQEYLAGSYGSIISGFFLAGDLNSEETQEAYIELTAPNSPLIDTLKTVDPQERYGSFNTFTGFGCEEERPMRLDYILFGPKEKQCGREDEPGKPSWAVEGHAVLPNRFDDGIFNSDHRAVVADVILI